MKNYKQNKINVIFKNGLIVIKKFFIIKLLRKPQENIFQSMMGKLNMPWDKHYIKKRSIIIKVVIMCIQRSNK